MVLPDEDAFRVVNFFNRSLTSKEEGLQLSPVARVSCARDLVCGATIMFGYDAWHAT